VDVTVWVGVTVGVAVIDAVTDGVGETDTPSQQLL
jgi:hypothetical protein